MKISSAFLSLFALWLGAFLASCESLRANDVLHLEKGGLVASMNVTKGTVEVNWHFLHANPIDEIVASLDGAPMGVPTIEKYPNAGARTEIFVLLDMTGQGRSSQIDSDKAALLQLVGAGKPHHRFAAWVYGQKPQLLVAPDSKVGALVNLIATAKPNSEPANLGAALRGMLDGLLALPAQRRGLFVLTDGHHDDILSAAEIANTAKSIGASVSFLISPSERFVNIADLQQIANATGGQLIRPADRKEFFKHPFELLDSGAMARFPFEMPLRYFWQSDPDVKVIFRFGNDRLELKSTIPVPVASAGQTAAYLADNHPIALVASGATILAGAGGLALLALRRRSDAPAAGAAAGGEGPAPLALLQDIGDGATYPVRAPVAQLGRANTNEIVLPDQTVSRLHAVLQQGGDGSFTIENRSAVNVVEVNHQAATSAVLTDGDLITLGGTTLRFSQPLAAGQGGRTGMS